MKLKPSHFYDPEPKAPDFDYVEANKPAWDKLEKDYSDWKARQVKPEEQNCCMVFCADQQGNAIRSEGECYQQALQHYNEHRLRYEGFEGEYQNDFPGVWEFRSPNGITIYMHEGLSPHKYYGTSKAKIESTEVRLDRINSPICISYQMTNELFELFCQENGIKLNKI